jgi:hypothetical protein
MLPNIVINLILSLKIGFLSFSRNQFSSPNSQDKESDLSHESRVLEKEQVSVAGPQPWSQKKNSQKASNPHNIWSYISKETEMF